ncbi:MAG: 3'-5' exonuclease [Lachnospiraceae bacterium]|nr:3'-5' exonuclease [Lachnospiraceae bacterium]
MTDRINMTKSDELHTRQKDSDKGKTVRSYVSLDLETTGLYPKQDRIIEIGAVKVVEHEVVDTYVTFVNPGRNLTEKVRELTGITGEDLAAAPFIEDCIQDLLEFTGELPLLGHSVLFDYSFVKRAAVNVGKTFDKEGIDTLQIARKYLPELESRNLGYLCRYFGIAHEEHRALGDALATHELYQILWGRFRQNDTVPENEVPQEQREISMPEDKIFLPHPLHYQVKKEGPITKHQKERLYELIERHKLTVDYQVEHLTKNEASRYTDKILATYGR